ncbi:hypothetical protein F4859DRAFT_374151 [Xylaria cf. heliscus]|nr:hypothetical protein F4859DRAFT_374151 [Xylaria cf. heliscus]
MSQIAILLPVHLKKGAKGPKGPKAAAVAAAVAAAAKAKAEVNVKVKVKVKFLAVTRQKQKQKAKWKQQPKQKQKLKKKQQQQKEQTRCQCQCRNPPAGKRAVCIDAVVGRLDPELALCDVCFFELKEMNDVRSAPTCQYPPNILHKRFRGPAKRLID